MRDRSLAWGLLLLLLLLPACGDQTGAPQPVPIPDSRLFRSTALMPDVTQDVVLLGLPAATAGAGKVTVTNGAVQVEVQASAVGGFWARLSARAADVLKVSYDGSEPALHTVPTLGVGVAPPPGPIAGVEPIVALGGGKVRVRGQVPSGVTQVLLSATLGGDAAIAPVDGALHFDVELIAAPGETVEVYNDEPTLGPAWVLVAP